MNTGHNNAVPDDTWRGTVNQEWCDYNDHLNLAYYVVIFDLATDAFYDTLEIGEYYRKLSNKSWFTAESHVCYLSEVFANEKIRCSTQLIDFDSKRLHYFHRMFRITDQVLVATNELLALHIDLTQRKVSGVTPTKLDNIQRMHKAHLCFDRPQQLGRTILIPNAMEE